MIELITIKELSGNYEEFIKLSLLSGYDKELIKDELVKNYFMCIIEADNEINIIEKFL